MEKNCQNCQTDLTENDFFCEKLGVCKHGMETRYCSRYICPKKGCRFESESKIIETVCTSCSDEHKSELQAKKDFKEGSFQQILNVDKTMCFETYPCQHYVTFIDNSARQHQILVSLREIKRICKSHGLDFNQYNPHRDDRDYY
jgi:hypothetical protein